MMFLKLQSKSSVMSPHPQCHHNVHEKSMEAEIMGQYRQTCIAMAGRGGLFLETYIETKREMVGIFILVASILLKCGYCHSVGEQYFACRESLGKGVEKAGSFV